MKKRLLVLAIMIMALSCLLAISVSAENKIIKLDTLPTLEEIHANPSAFVSHLDSFDSNSYAQKDSASVVVLSDLAETPSYYVYPSFYIFQGYEYWPTTTTLNSAISASGIEGAFASFANVSGNGANLSIIRVEVPTFVTRIDGNSKPEGGKNIKEIYFPTKIVIDSQTGLEKEIACVTDISGQDLFGGCSSLEIVHNTDKMPLGLNAHANFSGCSKLKEFKMPIGSTSIANYMFSDCSSLAKFEIPETVTSIGHFTFNNCSSLTELILPNGLTSVGKHAFGGCSKLEKIVMGANFTTFSRYNWDYETFSGCNSLKYIYLPATFANSVEAKSGDYKTIFNHDAKTIYFVTESDYDKIVEIQNKFITTNANSNIANATIELFDPNKDYEKYQAGLTKSVIVYGCNVCDTFYEGNHNYEGDGDCTHGVTCTQCLDEIDGFADHVYTETLVYPNGFAANGVYNKYCTNASDCAVGLVENGEKKPVFTALEDNGYSINADGTGIAFGGFVVNTEEFKLYNDLNEDDISFGIFVANPKYLGDTFMANGEVNATSGFLKVDMTSDEYTNIKIMLDGFTGTAQNLELVISLYAEVGEDVEYIQSEHTACANAKVTKSDATLYTVTLNSVANKPYKDMLDALPEYGKENEVA